MKSAMRISAFLFAGLFFWASCGGEGGSAGGGAGDAVAEIVPLALLGTDDLPESFNRNPPPVSQTPVTSNTGGTVQLPADFGSLGAEAFLVSSTTDTDRYQSLTIEFSQGMNKTSVESNLTVKDSDGTAVDGTFQWISSRRVLFDPKRELKQSENYTLEITDRAKSAANIALVPYTKDFTTEPDFAMTHTINSYAAGGNKGIVLNKTTHSTITVSSVVGNHEKIASLKIYKLGKSASVELCPAATCAVGTFNVNLNAAASIAPVEGGNTYYYEISTVNGKKYWKPFSFNWGKTVANTDAKITSAAQIVLPQGGLNVLGTMLERYAAGDFTMDYRAPDNSFHPGMSFNGIIELNTSSSRPRGNCRAGGGTNFTFLTDVGPFCDITVNGSTSFLGTIKFKSKVDVYLSDLTITQENGNVDANLAVNSDGRLDLGLGGKRVTGQLEIVMEITDTEHCTLFCIGVSGLTRGVYIYRTTISMNKSTHQWATAHATITSNTQGVTALGINGLSGFNLRNTINGSSGSTNYFNVKPWNDSLNVSAPTRISMEGGSWEFIDNLLEGLITRVVDEQVPNLKPEIVNGVLADVIQKIAANALNAVLKQVQSGISVNLPNYLPAPLNQVGLNLAATIRNDMAARKSGAKSGLTASADIALTASNGASNGRPETPHGVNSYISYKGAGGIPQQLDQSTPSQGALLGLHNDVLSQAFHNLWKNGAFNLTIDHAFINTIKSLSGTTELIALTEELLTADAITTILAPGQTNLTAYDSTGGTKVIKPTDKIILIVNPVQPPVIRVEDLPGGGGTTRPRLEAAFSDLEISIMGKDGSNPAYLISRVRATLTSKATLDFVSYSNPTNNPAMGDLAIKLSLSEADGEMYYIVDVMGGSSNPYALAPGRIREVVDPLVKTLILPLLNNVVRELPLPKMEACGIKINTLSPLDMPNNAFAAADRYVLVSAGLSNYAFSGNCSF